MSDEAIGTNKSLDSIIPEKEVTLRSKDMDMCNGRECFRRIGKEEGCKGRC